VDVCRQNSRTPVAYMDRLTIGDGVDYGSAFSLQSESGSAQHNSGIHESRARHENLDRCHLLQRGHLFSLAKTSHGHRATYP
jgi:hypothetical protein